MIQSLINMPASEAEPEAKDAARTSLQISEEEVTRSIHAWRERAFYLPTELLVDPAWGMLLELLQAEIQDRRASIARLCKISAVSSSSAIRWLRALENEGWVIRRPDSNIANNEFFELSVKASSALRRYFHDVVQSH